MSCVFVLYSIVSVFVIYFVGENVIQRMTLRTILLAIRAPVRQTRSFIVDADEINLHSFIQLESNTLGKTLITVNNESR